MEDLKRKIYYFNQKIEKSKNKIQPYSSKKIDIWEFQQMKMPWLIIADSQKIYKKANKIKLLECQSQQLNF